MIATGVEGLSDIDRAEEQVREIERKHDLLAVEVNNCCVWPLFRYQVLRRIASHGTSPPLRRAMPAGERMRDILAGLKTFVLPPRVRLLVRTQASGLLELREGLYRDIWFDDLLASTDSFLKLDSINNADLAGRRRLAAIPLTSTVEGFERIAAVVRRLKPQREARDAAAALHERLRAELGDKTPDLDRMCRAIEQFSAARMVYRNFLRRARPRFLLIEWAVGSSLVAAARDEGVEVVEFQHGIMRGSFGAYSWSDYALPYRPRMPLPDRIFLHGDYWAEELRTNGFWGERLRVVGSPRHDRYRELRAARARRSVEPTLVVTTQGIAVGELIDFLRSTVWHARAMGRQIRVITKTHPAYEGDAAAYRTAFASIPEMKVVTASEEPSTFGLLCEADLHASISSACHYDALGIGLPTTILPLRMHEAVLSLYRRGHASLSTSPECLAEELCGTAAPVSPQVSDYYFKRGAIENMKRELDLDP